MKLLQVGSSSTYMTETNIDLVGVNNNETIAGKKIFQQADFGYATYGEVTGFNSSGSHDRPYITVGKVANDGGLLLCMEKDLQQSRIGMHGGNSYCFKYSSKGAQTDALPGLALTEGIAFNILPKLGHVGLGIQGVSNSQTDLVDIQSANGNRLVVDQNCMLSVESSRHSTANINRGFVEKRVIEVADLSSWQTILTLTLSEIGVWTCFIIKAIITGNIQDTCNGMREKRFVIDVNDGNLSVAMQSTVVEYSGDVTHFPDISISTNTSQLNLQAHSGNEGKTFAGLIHIEMECPRGHGENGETFTYSIS